MERTTHIRSAIQSWLLSPEVQLADGPHRGGVVGWLDESGRAAFVYPEVTGYYLTWLAFLARAFGRSDGITRRAKEALSWISDHFVDCRVPLTRTYLASNEPDDWRNSGSFAFDLAMLARGVAAVRNLVDEGERTRLLAGLHERLLPFCTECDSLQAFRPHGSLHSDAASRWSCNPGPYQAKVATAILSTNTVSPIPDRLRSTAAAAYGRWRQYSQLRALVGDHPAFYHLEGLALAGANDVDAGAWSVARQAYLHIIGMRSPAAPLTPYFNGSASENRSDVLAQALRMGCILRSRGDLESATLEQKLQHLADVLGQFVGDDGAVLFRNRAPYRHKNVWSSMFAHQAFCFHEVVARGNSLEDDWLQLLV